ncbi:MAG: TlpA family protein disulfide reductase [Prevotella sp.]|nr:TlpA family protein disulfide reductase [Prevotella sp.]
MKKILFLLTLTFAITTNVMAEDIDSLYAKELLQPGTSAPEFTLNAIDGTSVSLSSLRGNYLVLDFWASWCPDCRKDVPRLKELHEQFSNVATFVSISFDDNKDNWTKYVNENNMDWLHLSELKKWKDTEISKLYNIKWIPTTYILDRNGDIILATVMIEKVADKLKELQEL